MSSCPSHSHDHIHDIAITHTTPIGLKIALVLALFINAGMFMVELSAGHFAFSSALLADSLDFLADALAYGITFAVLSASIIVRARIALAKCFVLFGLAVYVLATTLYQVTTQNLPDATVMVGVGVLALLANGLCVLLLYQFRTGDSNIRSVWLCSRNDMMGNIAVLAAAAGVFGTHTVWPDIIVATLMCGLFLHTSMTITRQAVHEIKNSSRY